MNEVVFTRNENNPIVTPEMVGGNVNSIHNSAIIKFKGKYLGIFRIDDLGLREGLYRGFSDDGINWKIEDKMIQATSAYPEIKDVIRLGFDPRITQIGDEYFISYCFWYYEHKFSTPSLLRTKDFETFEHLGFPLPPNNRNAVLFPRKINGKYYMLNRPNSDDEGRGNIIISSSPDLTNWGEHRCVMTRGGGWGWSKIGPGPAPIECDDGWLMIYHAVRDTFAGSVYVVGGAILDRDEPWKVLHRGVNYLLAPTKDYERLGDVGNVTFPTSALYDKDTGAIDLYYGCADTYLGLAHGKLDDIVAYIKKYRAETPDY